MAFILDNQAFSEVTKDESTARTFCALVRTREQKIIIPWAAMNESVEPRGAKALEHIRRRFRVFADILESLGPSHVGIGKEAARIMKREFELYGSCRRVPCIAPSAHQIYIDNFRDPVEFEKNLEISRDAAFRQREQKEQMLKGDKRHRDLKLNDDDQKSLIAYLEKWQGPMTGSLEQVEFVYVSVLARVSGVSKKQLRTALRSPDRYFFTRAILTMILYRFFFRRLDPDRLNASTRTAFEGLLKVTRGDWYDHNIAAYAGYGDVLVTNDGGLRTFCAYLTEKRVLNLRTIKFDDFTSGIGGD
jgi:hypothetical protein